MDRKIKGLVWAVRAHKAPAQLENNNNVNFESRYIAHVYVVLVAFQCRMPAVRPCAMLEADSTYCARPRQIQSADTVTHEKN